MTGWTAPDRDTLWQILFQFQHPDWHARPTDSADGTWHASNGHHRPGRALLRASAPPSAATSAPPPPRPTPKSTGPPSATPHTAGRCGRLLARASTGPGRITKVWPPDDRPTSTHSQPRRSGFTSHPDTAENRPDQVPGAPLVSWFMWKVNIRSASIRA